MPDFNIDDVLNKFGVKPASTTPSGLDVDSILSQFGVKPDTVAAPNDRPKVLITTPKPPISGATSEQSDAINAEPGIQGGANPRPLLPTTNISGAAYDAYRSGRDLINSGVEDAGTGHPYKAAGKTLLGAFQAARSPLTGLVEGGPVALANQIFPKANSDLPRDITGAPITDTPSNIASPGDRVGFAIDSAIPIVPGSKAALGVPTSASSAVNSSIKGLPKNKALSQLIEHIGPENLPAAVKLLKENPRLAPADLSPRVLQDTQNLFTTEGPHVNYLSNTSSARLAGAKGAATTALDASMGATVNAAQKVDQLKNAAREIGSKNINPVIAAKPHTDVTDLIKQIDTAIGYPAMKAIKEGKSPPLPLTPYQRELLDVRNKLRNPNWPDRDKMFAYTKQLHDAQIDLRETAQGLNKSAVGSERKVGGDLLKFREEMKKAVGPEYQEALAKYAGQKKVEEAFHNGYDTILSNSKKLENDPSFFEKWVNSKSRKPGELDAAKEGARLRIQHEIEGARTAATNPAAKATGIGQTDFSVKRIETLLGKDEAGKLLTALDHERMIANTHNKIVEGSQTAMRTASKEGRALPTKTEVMKSAPILMAAEGANFFYGGIPGAATAATVLAKVGAAAKDKVATTLARETNARYAKYALPTQGPDRDALIKSLEAAIPRPKKSMLTKASSLARLVGP